MKQELLLAEVIYFFFIFYFFCVWKNSYKRQVLLKYFYQKCTSQNWTIFHYKTDIVDLRFQNTMRWCVSIDSHGNNQLKKPIIVLKLVQRVQMLLPQSLHMPRVRFTFSNLYSNIWQNEHSCLCFIGFHILCTW